MATYLITGSLMDQGIKNIKETVHQGERFKEMAKEGQVTIRELFWLMGECTVFSFVEAEREESSMGFLLRTSSTGFVKTSTFWTYNKDEMAIAL